MKILIIDSGIGGLSVLTYLKQTCPNNHYTYLMDNDNFPYGEKNETEMLNVLNNVIKPLTKNYDYVIIACNTLSTIISKNKIKLHSPTITMMDLHKISAIGYFNQHVYVLATPLSTKSDIWQKTYKKVSVISGENLAKWIEDKEITKIVNFIKSLPTNDPIILSCTHYNFIKNWIINSVDITDKINYFIHNSESEYKLDFILTKNDSKKAKIIENFK